MANIRRENRLNGLFPLSYMGVIPTSPQNFIQDTRAPTSTDWQNFYIGDLWLDISSDTAPNYIPPTIDNLYILTSLDKNSATWVPFAGSAGTVTDLTGNTGGKVPPTAGNINVLGDTTVGLTIAGTPGTSTLLVTTVGGHPVGETITGNSGGPVPFTAPGNINVVGDGTTVNVVGNPGTNTLTISATNTGDLRTLTGDLGGAVSPVANNIDVITGLSTRNAGSSVFFETSGAGILRFNNTDANDNVIMGNLAGNLSISGINNTGTGSGVFQALTSGNRNCGFGTNALLANTTGTSNSVLGTAGLQASVSGTQNSGLGDGVLGNLVSGVANLALGYSSGTNYTGSESSNILLASAGTTGESGTIRIGSAFQTRAFMNGVAGVTTANPTFMSVDTVTNQLGTIANAVTMNTGVWTPTISIGGSSVGIVYGTGTFGSWYTIMNGTTRIAYVSASIQVTSNGGLSGAVNVTNIPFTPTSAITPPGGLSLCNFVSGVNLGSTAAVQVYPISTALSSTVSLIVGFNDGTTGTPLLASMLIPQWQIGVYFFYTY